MMDQALLHSCGKSKSRDLQKLLKYFNGTTTFVSNVLLLLAGVLSIIFAINPKDSLVTVLLLSIL